MERPDAAARISMMDPDIQECPFTAYQMLRDDEPVYQDRVTGFYIVSRHADIKAILADQETYSCRARIRPRQVVFPERWDAIQEIYAKEGWTHVPSLNHRDDPDHKQLRVIWDNAFRPGKMNELEPSIQRIVDDLFDGFIGEGQCDWVRQFAIPLPLRVICGLLGAPEEDIWKIRQWVDDWVAQNSLTLSPEEELATVRKVIEAQHYFQQFIERVRAHPDNTLFSEVVNTTIPEWGRKLTDHELQASMFADLFAAGSETTANALGSGMKLLIEHPDVWAQLKSAPEKYARTFVEEVLRMESPTQGMTRMTTKEVTLHGVTIPAGAVIHMRFGAANRDERHFEEPEKLDLERRHATSHFAFGAGTHHCVGAPLARRELLVAFTELTRRVDEMWFAPGKNDFEHHKSIIFRGVKELHIEFRTKA